MMFDPTLTKTELLARVEQFDVADYQKTRNHLKGTVSRLSPYITRGVISLPEIRDQVLKQCTPEVAEKFIQELAWREYWQRVWEAKVGEIFSDLRFSREDWAHEELVSALVAGSTGVEVIDRAVAELYETGYMHNHARMWVAMLACNVAQAHWCEMSRWLYYHLLDGDLASNTLSWQWVAGTNAGKRYVAHQELINACSGSTQTGTFLDVPREQVGEGAVPEVLQPHEPFVYETAYPETDAVPPLSGEVYLYSPWTLDGEWRGGEAAAPDAHRLLIIEPRWFDRFPISGKVIDFIIAVAKAQVPSIKVMVSEVENIDLSATSVVYSRAYPATSHWPGMRDESLRLFPEVSGYFPSFFKYWQQCRRFLPVAK